MAARDNPRVSTYNFTISHTVNKQLVFSRGKNVLELPDFCLLSTVMQGESEIKKIFSIRSIELSSYIYGFKMTYWKTKLRTND